MTNHATVERVARQLCEQRGLDFGAKGMAEASPVMETLARACGWRVG